LHSLTSLLLKRRRCWLHQWDIGKLHHLRFTASFFLSRQKDLDHKYLKIKSWLQFIRGKDLSWCPEKEEKRHAPRSSCAPSWVECPAPNPPTQVCSWKTHILDLVKIWYADGTHFWILIIEGIIELTGQMDLVPACNQISFEEESSCKGEMWGKTRAAWAF